MMDKIRHSLQPGLRSPNGRSNEERLGRSLDRARIQIKRLAQGKVRNRTLLIAGLAICFVPAYAQTGESGFDAVFKKGASLESSAPVPEAQVNGSEVKLVYAPDTSGVGLFT
jgi:hypothetical protein